jgi:hypothetical protein
MEVEPADEAVRWWSWWRKSFIFLFKGLLREEHLSKILPPFHNISYFRFVKQMYLDII